MTSGSGVVGVLLLREAAQSEQVCISAAVNAPATYYYRRPRARRSLDCRARALRGGFKDPGVSLASNYSIVPSVSVKGANNDNNN